MHATKNSDDRDPFEREEKSLEQMKGILAVFRLFDRINCPTFVPSFSLASHFFFIDIQHKNQAFFGRCFRRGYDKKTLMGVSICSGAQSAYQ